MASPRIVSVARGRDLLPEIAEAASGTDGWVQATGRVEGVEVRLAAEGADPVRAPRGRFVLAHLSGPCGGPYGVTVARASDGGAEVWAGELVRAVSDGVTLFIQPAAATRVEERPAPPARQAALPSSPVNEAATPVPGDWAKAALASAAVRRAAEAEHEPLVPEPGDLVHSLGETPFPARESSEATCRLSPEYRSFFDHVLQYARETIQVPGEAAVRQRIRWWAALALLRAIGSSPAAAAATLRSRAVALDAATAEEADEAGRTAVLDLAAEESATLSDVVAGSDVDTE